VKEVSLANHLALETCCQGAGNPDLLNRLSHVLYLSYLICEAEGAWDDFDAFRAAEATLDLAAQRAAETNVWRLGEADRPVLGRILAIHDAQLASVSTRTYASAVRRLGRLLLSERPVSPVGKTAPVRSGVADAHRSATPCKIEPKVEGAAPLL
jgi:hypothetical protein